MGPSQMFSWRRRRAVSVRVLIILRPSVHEVNWSTNRHDYGGSYTLMPYQTLPPPLERVRQSLLRECECIVSAFESG